MPKPRPEEYGHKTVHTGNRPHKPSSEAQRYLAQQWGRLHGYAGELGGWICKVEEENGQLVTGQHLAHGWGQFYHLMSGQIIAWASRIVGCTPFEKTAKELATEIKGMRIKAKKKYVPVKVGRGKIIHAARIIVYPDDIEHPAIIVFCTANRIKSQVHTMKGYQVTCKKCLMWIEDGKYPGAAEALIKQKHVLKKWHVFDTGGGLLVEREDGLEEWATGAHCPACALAAIVSKYPDADCDLRGLHHYGICYQFLAVIVRQRRRGIDNV